MSEMSQRSHILVVDLQMDSVGRTPEGQCSLVLQSEEQESQALVYDSRCEASVHDARIAADVAAVHVQDCLTLVPCTALGIWRCCPVSRPALC